MVLSLPHLFTALILLIPFAFAWWSAKTARPVNQINTLSAVLIVTVGILQFLISDFTHSDRELFKTLPAAFFSVLFIFWIRGKHLNQARGIAIEPRERFIASARTLAGMGLLYGIYLTVVHVIGSKFSLFVGVPLGMASILYATPLILRVMWNTKPIHDPEIASLVRRAFEGAHVKIGRLYFIEMGKVKFHNALVCGPRFGFGPFQRSLFITRSLFEHLTPDQVHAVLLHEASHFKLKHLQKRMGAAFTAFLLSFAMITAISYLNVLLFNQVITALVGLALFLLIQTPFVGIIARKHEFEADLEAVRMGASGPALIQALHKITELSGAHANAKPSAISRTVFGIVHPTIDEREAVLKRGFIPHKDQVQPIARYSVLFATILTVQLLLSSNSLKTTRTPARSIASDVSESKDHH